MQLIRCHCLYFFFISKASKLSTRSASVEGARRDRQHRLGERDGLVLLDKRSSASVSICTSALVKQVNWANLLDEGQQLLDLRERAGLLERR